MGAMARLSSTKRTLPLCGPVDPTLYLMSGFLTCSVACCPPSPQGDTVEAQACHLQLVQMVEAQDPRVLGDAGSVAKVVAVFVEALGRGTELVAEDTGRRMVALLQHLQLQAPAVAQEAFGRLSPKQQGHFQTWMSGAVPK